MKKILIVLLSICSLSAVSQYNNSWIDYSKTYYKFKVGSDNLYRITKSSLDSAGIGNTNVQDFQLWRNGEEVRIYTSIPSGPLGPNDFIEFWGRMNDGKKDNSLYIKPEYQPADRYSMETDTACFFLTINAGANNLRYTGSSNSAPITGAPEPYFIREQKVNYKGTINNGKAIYVPSEYLYSSSYDIGEGVATIYNATTHNLNLNNANSLNVYTEGPQTYDFSAVVSGASYFNRSVKFLVNNLQIAQDTLPDFQILKKEVNGLPLSQLLTTGTNKVNIYSTAISSDRISIAEIGLRYPAKFIFNNQKNFAFSLEPSANNRNIEITNFNHNKIQPVLYDLTSGSRYIGYLTTNATTAKVQFVLPPAAEKHDYVIASLDVSNVLYAANIGSRSFINYMAQDQQSNYMIVSNKKLEGSVPSVNPIEAYRAYRTSAAGGNFNAKVYDIDQLTDQYAYGIKQHPEAIRNFIKQAKTVYTDSIKYLLLLGRGVQYNTYFSSQDNPVMESINFVPSFGYPPSDILFTAEHGLSSPSIPVGRLGAINAEEIQSYLDKVKEYELNQNTPSPVIADKLWMKDEIGIAGGINEGQTTEFYFYNLNYKNKVEDTLFGGKYDIYRKTSSATVQIAYAQEIDNAINRGLGLINYFGHSSANTFEFNLQHPENYTNDGRYPFFLVSGCTAGNYYVLDNQRTNQYNSLSEKYVLVPNKGCIGFLASTSYGLAPVLHNYNSILYSNIVRNLYGKSIGEQIKRTTEEVGGLDTAIAFKNKIHNEEINLHGDPAIKITNFPLADYAIEPQYVQTSPSIVTTAETDFTLKVKYFNIGRATGDSIRILITRKYPNNVIDTIFNVKRLAAYYADSINLSLPVLVNRDRGLNEIAVMLDYDNQLNELFETNNGTVLQLYINDNSVKNIFPYDYSIVDYSNIVYTASTSNPMVEVSGYTMELDTTALFNSPAKRSFTTSSLGGLIEFSPSVNYLDSTVYYWRVSKDTLAGENRLWSKSSFIYLPGGGTGFNQSHYFQFLDNDFNLVELDSSRILRFEKFEVDIDVQNGLHTNPYYNTFVHLGNTPVAIWGQNYNTIQFVVFDGETGIAWQNVAAAGSGLYGSNAPTTSNIKQFGFYYNTPESRLKIMNFLDMLPQNAVVVAYNMVHFSQVNRFIADWKADTTLYGSGNSLYHRFYNLGLTAIDSFYRKVPFIFGFAKDGSVPLTQVVGNTQLEVISADIPFKVPQTAGFMKTVEVGPARSWQTFKWNGHSLENPTKDSVNFEIYGITTTGSENFILSVPQSQLERDISNIDATLYPNLKVKYLVWDTSRATPQQLDYWRINYQPLPEGALAPQLLLNMPDSSNIGDSIRFSIAFKNVSRYDFDSMMRVNITLVDKNNVSHFMQIPPRKIITAGDTLHIHYTIDSRDYSGLNTLFLEVNPNPSQPEQYHFNNVLYKQFYIVDDIFNPMLDVTFDGIHILNKDIVSSKPTILIKLTDENEFRALADTSLFDVSIIYPDGSVHKYHVGDTMRFTPANLASGENVATIELMPYLPMDGEYQLVVKGKDVGGNNAGALSYKVSFTVINKPMISNLFNYPNPFTTSTAFVFTITGSEIPEQLRIQVLTVTGKVVREINKHELGTLHIGRNITAFKWDGTDQYGDKLANGVYLYRVITKMNGQDMEKFETTTNGESTDKYFKKDYGKMYLMR